MLTILLQELHGDPLDDVRAQHAVQHGTLTEGARGARVLAEGALRKSIKQQEIRKRELQNLLEDVMELNLRSQAISDAAIDRPP